MLPISEYHAGTSDNLMLTLFFFRVRAALSSLVRPGLARGVGPCSTGLAGYRGELCLGVGAAVGFFLAVLVVSVSMSVVLARMQVLVLCTGDVVHGGAWCGVYVGLGSLCIGAIDRSMRIDMWLIGCVSVSGVRPVCMLGWYRCVLHCMSWIAIDCLCSGMTGTSLWYCRIGVGAVDIVSCVGMQLVPGCSPLLCLVG